MKNLKLHFRTLNSNISVISFQLSSPPPSTKKATFVEIICGIKLLKYEIEERANHSYIIFNLSLEFRKYSIYFFQVSVNDLL